ncbi:unnamed protein product [Prunus armeniaca]
MSQRIRRASQPQGGKATLPPLECPSAAGAVPLRSTLTITNSSTLATRDLAAMSLLSRYGRWTLNIYVVLQGV